jgi:hypothetical protein
LKTTGSGVLATIFSVTPIWIALMIIENLVETQAGWNLAVAVYILFSMILGLMLSFIWLEY